MGPTWDEVLCALDARPAVAVADTGTRAAVAVILRDTPAGIEMLFIRRAEHPEDPWSGHMAYPGGRAEAHDPDLQATSIRETHEEIGIDLSRSARLLGRLDDIRAMARGVAVDLAITPFVFRLMEEPVTELSHEVRSLHWIPLAVLFGPDSGSEMDYLHQGARVRLPCFRIGAGEDEVVIWGLTFRMCSGLRERFQVQATASGVPGPP
jgi:8-oxo-dGTP pyrophosphatase MutT (NUDIX family)